jgi:hypothetical protein
MDLYRIRIVYFIDHEFSLITTYYVDTNHIMLILTILC